MNKLLDLISPDMIAPVRNKQLTLSLSCLLMHRATTRMTTSRTASRKRSIRQRQQGHKSIALWLMMLLSLGTMSSLVQGGVIRVSENAAGVQGNDHSYFSAISADGQFVLFFSAASSLLPGDTNDKSDVFISDVASPTAPANLRAAVYSRTSAEVFWDRTVGQTYQYRVFFNGVLVGETDGVSWWSDNFSPDNTTDVKVVAIDSNGAESAPAVVSIRTGAARLSPVTGLRADIYSTTAAEIFWDRKSGVNNQYRIYSNGLEVATTNGTSWFSDAFGAGSVTRITVVAFDGSNESAQRHIHITTRDDSTEAPPYVMPAVTGLRAAVYGKRFAEVFWDRPTNQTYRYQIYFNGVYVNETDGTSWWSMDFEPKSTTQVGVIAFDSQGDASLPAVVYVVTHDGNVDPAKTRYTIGDIGPAGGIVFSVSAEGTRGLEAAPMDQSNAVWCNQFSDIPGVVNLNGPTHIDPNSGAANTAMILSSSDCHGELSAAEEASTYVWPNGESDGYLPNKDELNLLFNQRFVIGGFETSDYVSTDYWSSSESEFSGAWIQTFSSGDWDITSKDNPIRVRAIRTF